MRERAFIHVAGPAGAGKTAFVEVLLRAFDGPAICVRGEVDARLREPRESAPARDPELRRYGEAGASGVSRYCFPPGEGDRDSFFSTRFMNDYSQAVVIEGDCPLEHVDLVVFVAPALKPGAHVLEVTERPERAAAVDQFQALLRPGALSEALQAGRGEELLEMARVYQESLGRVLGAMSGKGRRRPSLTKEWSVTPMLQGIERAGLIVVNARSDKERTEGERMLPEIAQLRSDDEIRIAVLGRFAHRIPVTAVVADLADPKDAGTRKAVAKVKRTISHRSDRR